MPDYFVDTNILLRLADETSVFHPVVTKTITGLVANKNRLCITRQNIAEFWAVATRAKEANGLGWSLTQAQHHLEMILETFVFIEAKTDPTMFLEFLIRHAVQGKQVHDANLAFTIQQSGIVHLITLNDADFKRFTNIQILKPQEEA
jgi:predicted nucleic acid-binding protein